VNARSFLRDEAGDGAGSSMLGLALALCVLVLVAGAIVVFVYNGLFHFGGEDPSTNWK
jgi:hypothetical protein